MLNLASSEGYVQAIKWDYPASLQMIEEWLPCLPPGFARTQQLCDMAFYTGVLGHKNKALVLMEQAARSMERADDVTGAERYYYGLTMARINLGFGSSAEILERLLAQCPNEFQRVQIALFWTEVLLHQKEHQAAERYLTLAQQMMTPEMPARLHRLAVDYSRQL